MLVLSIYFICCERPVMALYCDVVAVKVDDAGGRVSCRLIQGKRVKSEI